jgi:hypothetical protein
MKFRAYEDINVTMVEVTTKLLNYPFHHPQGQSCPKSLQEWSMYFSDSASHVQYVTDRYQHRGVDERGK